MWPLKQKIINTKIFWLYIVNEQKAGVISAFVEYLPTSKNINVFMKQGENFFS